MAHTFRPLDVYPITTRTLEVLRVADVTPGMRRVTLGGPQLAAHIAANGYPVAAFRSDGFDDEGKLFLKHPDAAVAVGPEQADGVLSWPREDPHLLFRTYTVRRWDPDLGELDLDFVRHGVGPAATWAYSVQPGETVQWAGPKMSAPHPVGVDWTLVAGDETALPAIGRWLEEWPAGARGQVFIEVAEAAHRQLHLPVPEGVELTWLTRDGAEPGTTSLLFDAITSAEWWDGTVFAWVAGETLTLTPIRRWLRGEKGLAKEQVEVTGYWRRQAVVVSDDSGVQDLDATEDEGEAFHALTGLAAGFAVRVAATIGLASAISAGAKSIDELASETGTDRTGLAKLVRYLADLGLVEHTDGVVSLTSLGRELDDDDEEAELSLDRLPAQRELGGLLSLLAAVRTGRGDHAHWCGSEWSAREADEAVLADRIVDEAEDAGYTAGALAAAPALAGLGTIAVAGRGSGTVARALVDAHPDARASIVASPSEAAALRAAHGDHEQVSYTPGSLLARRADPVDATLLTDALHTLPDADAAHALREAAASTRVGGRLLVFGEVLDPALADDHDYEDDLIDFVLTGGGARTHDEHLRLFAAAGLGVPERSTIGWGYTLYALTIRGA